MLSETKMPVNGVIYHITELKTSVLLRLIITKFMFCINEFSINIQEEFVFSCSVAQLCLTLWDAMDCNMPGFPVLHHLQVLAQTHGH